MKTIFDDNFLNGHLEIILDGTNSKGNFAYFDADLDELVEINVKAQCHKDDLYRESVAIDIIKLKIVNKYYHMRATKARAFIRFANELLKEYNKELEFVSKKLNNSEKALEKYGLSFEKKTTKPVKPKSRKKSSKGISKNNNTKK